MTIREAVMRVFIQVKSAGKRRPALEKREYGLPDGILILRELIHAVVDAEVSAYNAKSVDAAVTRVLTETEIEDGAKQGKVGFDVYIPIKKLIWKKHVRLLFRPLRMGCFVSLSMIESAVT